MRQFRDDPGLRVFVSTEVGSEGLDFQFCHHVVNYDLPWNPMVVEQRIGRIDRFGQESEVVHIHNLIVSGTVEDRILWRLYDRIGIFRESIGDLEPIIGETIGQLQADYVSGRLTPEEAERRVEQASHAIGQRRIHMDSLEKSAAELFGHEEYIRDEMMRVGRLGRYVTERAILAVLESFLESHHPVCRLWKERDEGVFGLRITDELRRDIHEAARGGPAWTERSKDGTLRITTRGELAFRDSTVELINAVHPLLRASVRRLKPQLESPNARIGHGLLLASDPTRDCFRGDYFIALFSHTIEGVRSRRVLETIAWSCEDNRVIEDEDGERLLHLLLEEGQEWSLQESAPSVPADVWNAVLAQARGRNRALRERESRENDALYIRRKNALRMEFDHVKRVKERRLRTAEARGHIRVVPALQGQVLKAEAEFNANLSDLERTKTLAARLSDPIAVCYVRVVSETSK